MFMTETTFLRQSLLVFSWLLFALAVGWQAVNATRRLGWWLPVTVGLLFTGAMALRLMLAPWGPGDFNVNVCLPAYGEAPCLVIRAIGAIIGLSPKVPIFVSLVFGSLAAAFLVPMALALGMDRRTALAAGLLLAVTPLAVRSSGDGERQSFVLLLSILATASLAVWGHLRNVPALVAFLSGGLLCTASHPSALLYLPVAWVTLVVFERPQERLRAAGAVLALTGFVVAFVPVSMKLMHMAKGYAPWRLPGAATTVWLNTDFTAIAVLGLMVVGALTGIVGRDRVVTWAIAAAVVVAVPAIRHPIAEMNLASARYQTLSLPMVSLIAAFGITRVLEAMSRYGGRKAVLCGATILAVMVVGTSVEPMRATMARRTIDYEYEFLSKVVTKLPSNARIYIVNPPGHVENGLRFLEEISRFSGMEGQRWVQVPPGPLADLSGAFYYRQPVCSSDGETPGAAAMVAQCERIERSLRLRPLAETTVPAKRFAREGYAGPYVRLGIYYILPFDQATEPFPYDAGPVQGPL